MRLVGIRENEVTVELDWADVKYLTFIIRHGISHDVASTTSEPTMFVSYAETAEALLLAAGMASWAHTVDEENYTVERFLEVVQLTPEEHRRWRERCEAAQRELGILPAATEAPPAEGKGGEAA